VADHILPRAQGGTSERDNLQRAHRECNARKGGGAKSSRTRPTGPASARLFSPYTMGKPLRDGGR
jgi:5-methylcytosine-specific restriction endonuclease McrA